MDLAYIIENTTDEYIDNTALFKIIKDLEIEDEIIYSYIAGCRDEFEKLLDDLDNTLIEASSKRLVIRSVVDISDTAKGLLGIIQGRLPRQRLSNFQESHPLPYIEH